jgi:hypothetical protein|tara:strand:- start:136 stop:504 length:369 start_codon:yes stop_codon:yes gene_type:complete
MNESRIYDDISVTNTLIEKEMKYFDKYGQRYIFPSVTINNMTYKGQLEIEAVMNAICAGFKKAPGVCQQLLETNDINNPDVMFIERHHRFSKLMVFTICVTIMLCISIILCLYRRHAKREMK